MGKFWLKPWVWIKLSLFVAMAIYVLTFAFENYGSKVQFWYWRTAPLQTNALVLAFFAFLAGVVATVLLRTTLNTLQQIRELKTRNRQERLHRDVEEMKLKAAMLQAKPPGDRMAET